MTSVLVTGSSGLIGKRVIAQLAERTGDISHLVAMDLQDVPREKWLPGVTYLSGDIRNPQLGKLLKEHEVTCVVHLAAIVMPRERSTPDLEYSIDVLGSENVLKACLEAGVRQLVYTSSGAAYGYHADNPVPLVEDDPLRGNPGFTYSAHKRLVEAMLARAREEHMQLAQLIFRPGTILGETVKNPITAIFERPIVLGVLGSDSPFVFVWDEDVAAAIVKGIREHRCGIFNLAGDGAITLREIARRLGKPYLPVPAFVFAGILRVARAMGLTHLGPEQVRFLRYRPVLSNERLKNEFGFTPSCSSEACFDRYRALHFPN